VSQAEEVMGLGQIFLTWVRSGQPSLVWVWIRKTPPKNHNFSIFFDSDQKKSLRVKVKDGPASYLL